MKQQTLCRFCGRESVISDHVYLSNTYCTGCSKLRKEIAGAYFSRGAQEAIIVGQHVLSPNSGLRPEEKGLHIRWNLRKLSEWPPSEG